MKLPIALLLLAVLSAAVVAYGTDPAWGQYPHGVMFIVNCRRLQWPMLATSLALCMAVAGLVIANRRRAWWLIGLLPVLALFLHRFVTGPLASVRVVENPVMAAADAGPVPIDLEQVVGVHLGEAAFAYPCKLLTDRPAIVQEQRGRRMLLMFSPLANVATAFAVSRDVAAGSLDIVSTPDAALLLYDQRSGQFFDGVTGLTFPGRQLPRGFGQPLQTELTSWGEWRRLNPQSSVMVPTADDASRWQHAPLWRVYPIPAPANGPAVSDLVCLVRTTPPLAVPESAITDRPLNLAVGEIPILLLRDTATGQVHAYDRRLEKDLIPRFAVAEGSNHPEAVMVDTDTASEWTAAGAVAGGAKQMQGKKLLPLVVEDNVDWAAVHFWEPDVKVVQGAALAAAIEQPLRPGIAIGPGNAPQGTSSSTRHRRRRTRSGG